MIENIISMYLFITIITTISLTNIVMSKMRLAYSREFILLCATITIYIFGYLMELNSNYESKMIFWNQIQYLAIPFYVGLWLSVTLIYTKRVKKINKTLFIIIFFIPIITFIARLTNNFHHLFYTSMQAVEKNGIIFLQLEKGILYHLQSAYNILLLIAINVVLLVEHKKTANKTDKKRYIYAFIASSIPIISIFLLMFDFLGYNIDFGALAVPLSVGLVIYAIWKYNFLDLKIKTRDIIFLSNDSGMLILDDDNKVVDYNDAAFNFFKNNDIDLEDLDLNSIKNDQLCLALKEKNTEIYKLDDKYYEIKTDIMKDKKSRIIGLLKTITDITNKKCVEEELKKFATIDELSGLNNRRKFMELALSEFAFSSKNDRKFCLIMMDIDYFKNVNDKYGHSVGDLMIKFIGETIKSYFKKTDIYGRLGGEEFAVVLRNTEIEEGYKIAEQFRKTVERNILEYEDIKVDITVSIGVVEYNGKMDKFEQLLRLSDKLMYESKAKGRNCTTVLYNNK